MNREQKLVIKKALFSKAVEMIESRISTSLASMENAQRASVEEEKSSAGDKYETSRAMNHLEKDMYAKQVAENRKELELLQNIKYDMVYESGVPGSLVTCSECSFFIASGIGKVNFEDKIIYFVSANAALAKLFYDKKPGDTIHFNNRDFLILSVY